jgi:hypothetical protein
MLSTLTWTDGIETPLASARTAVWRIVTPASTPVMWFIAAWAVLSWKCISSGLPLARPAISGIQVRARSALITPASSPRISDSTLSSSARAVITPT